jgi:hypothetical protein
MLKAHYHAPSQIITPAQLADAVEYKNYGGANLHYGNIGKMIAEYLNYVPPTHTNNEQPFWSIVLANRYQDDKQQWYWALRPEVAQALDDCPEILEPK